MPSSPIMQTNPILCELIAKHGEHNGLLLVRVPLLAALQAVGTSLHISVLAGMTVLRSTRLLRTQMPS